MRCGSKPFIRVPNMRRRRYSVVGPLILILIGVIVLLGNAGALPIGAGDLLLRLWPLILVAVGLQGLFGRRSAVGAVLVVVLTAGLGAGVVWYSVTTGAIGTSPLEMRAISQSLDGATEADVTINLSMGRLTVGILMDSPNLLEGSVTEGDGLTARATPRVSGRTLRYTLESEGFIFLPGGSPEWVLNLNGRVPLQLRIDHSLGDAAIDLSGLSLSRAIIDTSVGESTITVPRSGRPTVEIDHSVGGLRVLVPEGMDARIRVDTGIGGLDIAPRFRKVGDDAYETAGYPSADDRVSIIIDHSIGEVFIR